MSWETRKGSGRYYTRSRRQGGRIVREYIGTGEIAELIAQVDELDRECRENERTMQRIALTEAEALEAPIKALHTEVELIARGALLVAGFHRHHGGEWRRRRD